MTKYFIITLVVFLPRISFAQLDCSGVADGSSLLDDCGDCQQAYIYNFITHAVEFIDSAEGVEVGPNETVVLPDSPGNPYWNASCTDCSGNVNGSSLVDECGDCQQAYIYNFITHAVEFVDSAEGVEVGPNETVVLPDSPGNPYWNASCLVDCSGVADGSSLLDDCGDCQQAYIYNFITHAVEFIDSAEGAEVGPNETVVLPDSPGNPYWNASCTDCSGNVNGSSLVDECGDCQQAYIYNFITHAVEFVDSAEGVEVGPNETVVLPDSPGNPYWNASCLVDCSGVADGSSLLDDCGDCQQAYIYNFITHAVEFIDSAEGAEVGPNETVVLPDSPGNPYWNASCTDCSGNVNGSSLVDECGDCQQAYIYNFITHAVEFVDSAEGVEVGPNETVVLPDSPGNPYWNASCSSVAGCMDSSACNFNYLATEDDGTCGLLDACGECQIPFCYDPVTHVVSYVGLAECVDNIWIGPELLSNPNYNASWNSSCEVLGCTYPNACNYNAGSNQDNGSCEWTSCITQGCTYVDADNYNSSATSDDGSCTYSQLSCPSDLNKDGIVGVPDLLLFLGDFAMSCSN